MNEQLEKIREAFPRFVSKFGMFINKHRVVVVVLIACSAIIATLLQTGQYIDPPRDEDKYLEERSQINYKVIDQEVLTKLQKTQEDQDINVSSEFVPGRSNPFTE